MSGSATSIGNRPFIGRTRELAALGAALHAAGRGRGGFVVVLGEPGIGKTRTLEELAGRARRRARVLWGRCREGGDLPAYWPWVQVLRSWAAGVPAGDLRAQLGPGAADLARLIPGLGTLPVEARPSAARDPADARLRLFHAIATLLRHASGEMPLLVVLDDLHWADEASLHLLRLLVGELADARVLIVAACRDAELRRDPALTALVGELVTSSERVPLGPLAAAEVGDLITAVAGGAAPGGVVAAVHQRTGGNPLFVHELTRLLVADGALAEGDPRRWRIPEGVRAAIRHRLMALAPASREALAAAAVAGREFSITLVAGALGMPVLRTLALLDDAASLGMLQPVVDLPDRRRFSHVLVRDTLYEDLSAEARAGWHGRVGDVMAGLHADDPAHLPALAYHFLQAGPAGGWARAIEYAARAGDRALALLAYEEAVGHYTSALDALARSGRDDSARRTALLLARGEAERSAGDRAAARATFRSAGELARGRGAAADLARAALGFTGMWIHQLMVDADNVALLEAALGLLGEREPALRARLLARLAMELYYSPAVARCMALGAEAIDLARRVDDPDTLAFALHAYNWALWRPDRLAERRAAAAEMVAVAERSGSPELLAESLAWRVRAEMDAGDMAAVDAAIATHERLAQETRRPLDLWRSLEWRVTRATMAGRFADAERLLPEALAAATVAAERSQYYLALLYYAWDVHCLRREQGRPGDVFDEVGHLTQPLAMLQSVRVSLTEIDLAAGRHEEARRVLDEYAATDFAAMPWDVTWLRDVTLLAQVAVEVGDGARAAVLYDRLLPCAGTHVALGALGYLGPLDRHLGRLAAALGRLDDAVAHFETALAACERVGAQPQLARTQDDLAAVLRRRGAVGDVARAQRLRDAAARTMAAHGMDGVPSSQAAVCEAAARPGPPAPAEVAGPPVFRRNGDVWTLGFEGRVVRLADSKGMRQIACLLANPRAPQHALDLAAAGEPPGDPRVADGDAGPLLDAPARAAYRARLRDARAELEEARRLGDLGAAQRAEREIDALGRELARAVGLNGRHRRGGAAAERARVAVVRTIGRAIARIAAVHPRMAHHLRTTIGTGTACIYDPGPDPPPRWLL